MAVAPDFRFRILTALGNVEAWDGEPQRALTYMEEAQSVLGDVSLRQRAAFLSGLALQYRRVGDLERSIRSGSESLALYQTADAEREEAALENNLAITYMELGNTDRAADHLLRARTLAEREADPRLLSEVTEAEARLALARGDLEAAAERARVALDSMPSGGSLPGGRRSARHPRADCSEAGRSRRGEGEFDAAAGLLRERRARSQLREVLAEWAEIRTGWGDLQGATSSMPRPSAEGRRHPDEPRGGHGRRALPA